MKTIILSFFFSFLMLNAFSQEKTKQQIKEEQKAIKQKETDVLVASREYEFVADMAYPQGTRSVNLTTNDNFFRFEKDTIHSDMPFFGRAYSGVGYGSGDGGLKFKGIATDYSVKKSKKHYIIKADVKDNTDSYGIVLTVYFDGGANLSINSSNRSSINYSGKIDKRKIQ